VVDSKTIAVVAVTKVDVAWVDVDVVIWVQIVVVMVVLHAAVMADIIMATSVVVLEAVPAEVATEALQEAVMAMGHQQEVVIITDPHKVAGTLVHLVMVHQIMDMAAAMVVVMAVVITNHKAVAVDMEAHQWVVVVVAAATEAVIIKETAVEVVVVVAVPIAADKIIEAVLVLTELLSPSPPLCFV